MAKAIKVNSVAQAVSITKLVWAGLFDLARELLLEQDINTVQEKTDRSAAALHSGGVDASWLSNLSAVYSSAYSQFFSEQGVSSFPKELSKYAELVFIDKRTPHGCEEESLLISGTNLLGCCIAKSLRLTAAAERRLVSTTEQAHFKLTKQRWVRPGETRMAMQFELN